MIAFGSDTMPIEIWQPEHGHLAQLGQPRYAFTNALLAEIFARHDPVIVAHRGVSAGMVPENTTASTRAAFQSGADMVEVDVVASKDGHYYAFHTGTERQNLGKDVILESLTSAEIDELAYLTPARKGRVRRVERLSEILQSFRGEYLFNIDRSWSYWPDLLDRLAELDMTEQLLLKCPAHERAAIQALREHPVPFPFMLICRTEAEVEAYIDDPQLNLVGLELIADTSTHALQNPEVHRRIHERSLFTFANAEMLGDHPDLFAGFDDEASLDDGPDRGWGMLIDMGFSAIQTDWPWLLSYYRDRRSRAALLE